MISAHFYPYVGGGERQLQQLSERLIRRSWSVSVLTRRQTRSYSYLPDSFEEIRSIPIYRVPSYGPGFLGSLCFLFASLIFLAINHRQAIYHAHGIGTPAWISILASFLFRGKSIVKLRSGPGLYQASRSTLFGRLSLYFQFRYADRLLVVNKELVNLLPQWKVPVDHVFYFPNSIDITEFRPATTEIYRTLREQWDLCGKHVFLYAGRLAPVKRVDTLLLAWSGLHPDQLETCILLIVGDGPQRSELESQVSITDIGRSVRFLGQRADILELLWCSDVFVLPSQTEGLSNAMLEAMACALPIVCTAVGGALDWLQQGVNGYLSTPGDVDELHWALTSMLENRPKWKSMGEHSRKIVERELSWNRTIVRLEDLYRELSVK